MTPFMLYIWQILNSICIILGVFATVSLLAVLVTLIMIVEDYLKTYRPTIIFTTLTIFCALASALIPSTKQAAIIFGVPMLLEQAQNMNADKIPVKLIDYLNTYLDAETKKLKETSK